jgi:hypothetical protein
MSKQPGFQPAALCAIVLLGRTVLPRIAGEREPGPEEL